MRKRPRLSAPRVAAVLVTLALASCTSPSSPESQVTPATVTASASSATAAASVSARSSTTAASTAIHTNEPTPAVTPTPAPLLTFDPTLSIETTGDLSELAGAPQDFVDFVASMLGAADTCSVTVGVDAVDPAGWAVGFWEACGGAATIWKRTDVGWVEVAGSQDLWSCDDLEAAKVPPELLTSRTGKPSLCYDTDGTQPYDGQ